MIFYRKHRISIGNIEFLSETQNFYRIEPSKQSIIHRESFHLYRQTCPTPLRIITDFLSETSNFYRKLWISIGNGLNFYRNVMSRNTNKKYISIGEQHASIVLLISTAKLIKLFSIGIFSIGLHFYRNYSRDLRRFLPSTERFFLKKSLILQNTDYPFKAHQ